MAVSITEVLQGLGEMSVDLDWDPDIAAWFDAEEGEHPHLLIYEGETHRHSIVVTQPSPGPYGMRLAGRSLEWHLGVESTGPIIDDREYVSGRNKLSNGDFALGELYWRLAEGTKWQIANGVATTTGDLDKDDVLTSDESFPCRPGDRFRLTVTAGRDNLNARGRLRGRVVFEGKFDPPNLYRNGGFEEDDPVSGWEGYSRSGSGTDILIVQDPEHAHSGTHVLRMHATKYSPLVNNNGGFEFGNLDQWNTDEMIGDWVVSTDQHFSGAYAVGIAGTTPAIDAVLHRREIVPVQAGETWRVEGGFEQTLGADGTATVQCYVVDKAHPDPASVSYVHLATVTNEVTDWRFVQADTTIQENKVGLVPEMRVSGQTVGIWWFDQINLVRLKGNTAGAAHELFVVVPERTYKFTARVRSDPTQVEGDFYPVLHILGTGDPIVMEGPHQSKTAQTPATQTFVPPPPADVWQLYTYSFTPPSGTDFMSIFPEVKDNEGGPFWVDDMSVVDEDRSTVVFDEVMESWPTLPASIDVEAPAGTTAMHIEVVAEAGGGGWTVEDVDVHRIDVPYATAEEIVADLLNDPDTGSPKLLPGTIHPAGIINNDWRILNLTNRAALGHLSTTQVTPAREWRVNPDATLDWGLPEQLFGDHTDLVFGPNDFFVQGPAEVAQSNEDRVTDLTVVGAEHGDVRITGSAHNDPGPARDWFGNPIHRRQVVEDATVDQVRIADDFAAYLAGKANGTVNIRITLVDPRVLGPIGVGDWVYLWDPKSGLTDETIELPLPDGTLVNPVRKRVLTVNRTLTRGPHRALLRFPDIDGLGERTVDISDQVRWDTATTVELEVGDLLPEFAAAPEGGSASQQFLRYRAATLPRR